MTWTGKTSTFDVATLDRQGEVPLWGDEYVEETIASYLFVGDLERQGEVPIWSEYVGEATSFSIERVPTPETNPYVITASLAPYAGETEVDPQGLSLVIPLGDIVPETEKRGVNVLGETHADVESIGVEDTLVKVSVDDGGGGGWLSVYENGAAQNGWSASKPANDEYGFDYELTPPSDLPDDSLISVRVEVWDGLRFFECYSYTFETKELDSTPPYVTDQDPAAGSTDVPRDGPFEFAVGDNVGVVLIKVYWDGQEIYDGSSWDAAWSGSVIDPNAINGYNVSLVPTDPVDGSSTFLVQVYVEDAMGLSATESWSFTTEAEFSWDIWRFLMQSMRDLDRHYGDLLVWRWLRGPQKEWEATYARIKSLMKINDPAETPADALQYLKWIVGLTSKLDYLTGGLAEADLRRLISIAARMWKYKGTSKGLVETLESMSAKQVRTLNWFHFRVLIEEMEIGHAELYPDVWLLDEPGMSPSTYPDALEVDGVLEMDLLPSADDPGWTYHAVNGGAEGTHFSLSAGRLYHDQHVGNDEGGYYTREDAALDPTAAEFGARWTGTDVVSLNGRPWRIGLGDGVREYFLQWSDVTVALVDAGGTVRAGPINYRFVAGETYRMRIQRTGTYVKASINGIDVFGNVNASTFAASAWSGYTFGYNDVSAVQTWGVHWDDVGPLPTLDFDLSTLLGTTEAVPHRVRVKYVPKNVVRTVYSFWDGSANRCHVTDGFGLPAPLSTDTLNDFRVGVDPDEFCSDVRVVDDGDVDRDLIENLVRVMRPANERIFVRWLAFQDKFKRSGAWLTVSGTPVEDFDAGEITLPAGCVFKTDANLDANWTNLTAWIQVKFSDVPGGRCELRFDYLDEDNFHAIGFDPLGANRKVYLDKVIGGVRTELDSRVYPANFREDIYYNLMVQTEIVAGPTLLIKGFLDGDKVLEATNDERHEGKLAIASLTGQEATCRLVDVSVCPHEYARIGPPPDGDPPDSNECAEWP